MPLTSIVDTANKKPGIYLQISLGVGPTSAGDAPRSVLLYGNKTTSGTATVAVPVPVYTEQDAKTLFGSGSELHLMCRAALRANPSVTLYAVPVAESAGTQASDTYTVTGPATAAGAVTVTVHGETISIAVANADTATTIASAVSAAINAQTDWPVTATPAAGVVTITAKLKGPRGNFISVRGASATAGVTVVVASAYLTAGATSDDPQAALDASDPVRYHYHVAPYQDSTQLAKFKTKVAAQAMPTVGQRELWVAGSIDTLANTTTVATTLNDALGQIGWHFNADDSPAMVAAALAAFRAGEEGADPAANLDHGVLLYIKPQYTQADWPVDTEIISALNNGITPLEVLSTQVAINRSITSRSKDTAGNQNYAVLDTSKVVVPFFVADDLATNFGSEFAGFKLAPDDADGAAPDPGVATPKTVRDWIQTRLKVHEGNQILTNVDLWAPNLVVEIASSPAGRVNATVPVDPIEGFHQAAIDVRQIG